MKVREQQWEYVKGAIQLAPSRFREDIPFCLDVQDHSGTLPYSETYEPGVIVNPCSDAPTQQWHLDQDPRSPEVNLRIRNDATDQCLEAVEGDDEESYQLSSSLCIDGQVNQQWSYLD